MGVAAIVVVVLACVLLVALASLYSVGRFAGRRMGKPSSALPVPDQGTALDAVAAPLLARHPGESGMVLLADNLDAFAVRALSARRAGRSLDLQYYIWANDLTGRLLAHEIVQAADRGVRVRILLDDINAQGLDRAHLALAVHPNIDVRLFNPSRYREGALARAVEMILRAASANRRMHNKAWIADGRLAVVGGRNVGDAYFDAAEAANFRDLDMVVLGPAVRQAEEMFDRFWNCRAAVPISRLGKRRARDLPRLRRRLADLAASERAAPYLAGVAGSDTVRRMLDGEGRIHWSTQAQVVSDPPEKAEGRGQADWLMNAIRPLLVAARTDIEIVSPYFIPGRNGTTRLVQAAERGVRVAVLTNSLAATDVAAVHGAYARYRRPLVAAGVRLFELKPYDDKRLSLFGSSGASLHTKAFTVDGRTGFVGSMNFDPRSISLNTEMGVLFEHEDLVREIRAAFADETSPRKSYRVLLEGGAIRWEDRAAGAVRLLEREPEAGFWRRATTALIGLLPIESQL